MNRPEDARDRLHQIALAGDELVATSNTRAPHHGTERLRGVSETLLISLAARAIGSATLPHWHGGDPIAERLCRELAVDFARYGASPSTVKGTVARGRWFDARCMWALEQLDNPVFVSLASGLNTMYERVAARVEERPFTWIDTDLPDVVALRRRLLPDDERRHTLVLDATMSDWRAVIDRVAGRPVVFIAEGLLMYLDDTTGPALFGSIAANFAGEAAVHCLFDWASPLMTRASRKHPAVGKLKDRDIAFHWSLHRARDIARFDPRWRIIDERDVTRESGGGIAILGLLHRLSTFRQFYGCAHAALA